MLSVSTLCGYRHGPRTHPVTARALVPLFVLPKRPRAAELAKIVGAKCDDAPVANDDARNAFYRDDMRARISTKTQPEEAGG